MMKAPIKRFIHLKMPKPFIYSIPLIRVPNKTIRHSRASSDWVFKTIKTKCHCHDVECV